MSANIVIKNLRVPTVIGVYDFEKAAPQALKLDLELKLKRSTGSFSDRLRDTVDYDAVIRTVKDFGMAEQHELLEKFTYDLAKLLLQQFPLASVDLTAWKHIATHAPAEIAVRVNLQASENWQADSWGHWREDALND
jgi:7,8-dihydroneopterin aldolase/epimerase/oxygenase